MPVADRRSRERREVVEPPLDARRDERDQAHREHDDGRVSERREDLRSEDLATISRAREDRLQRPVVALRCNDVAGDERRDQGERPDRHEEQNDERRRQPRLPDVTAQRDVVRAAGLQDQHRDEDQGHEHRGTQAEVGPLLREQLQHLPFVDECHGRSGAGKAGTSLLCGSVEPTPRVKRPPRARSCRGTAPRASRREASAQRCRFPPGRERC